MFCESQRPSEQYFSTFILEKIKCFKNVAEDVVNVLGMALFDFIPGTL